MAGAIFLLLNPASSLLLACHPDQPWTVCHPPTDYEAVTERAITERWPLFQLWLGFPDPRYTPWVRS